MTFMNNIGPDEIARRKTKSDYINNTDAVTFAIQESNRQAAAYQKVRALKDELALAATLKDGEL